MIQHHRRRTTLTAAAALALSTAPPLQAAQYTVTQLTLSPTAINASGQICGWNPTYKACVWTPNSAGGGTFTSLPQPPGTTSNPTAINSFGQVVGQGFSSLSVALWTPAGNGTYTVQDVNAANPLGLEPAVGNVTINNPGAVVGCGWDFYHAGGELMLLWTPTSPNGTTGALAAIGGGGGSYANPSAINASGQIVGQFANNVSSQTFPFLWSPATQSVLPIGSLPGGNGSGSAHDINDAGQIVGASSVGPSTSHAFLWTPITPNASTGTMIDLDPLSPAGVSSYAYAINASGVVVGSRSGEAFIWTATDGLQNLNDLLLDALPRPLTQVEGINDAGQIIATSVYDPDGPGGVSAIIEDFLLTPIPEPTSLALLLPAALLLFSRGKSPTTR